MFGLLFFIDGDGASAFDFVKAFWRNLVFLVMCYFGVMDLEFF